MVGTRRKARAIALQALYEVDVSGHPPREVVNRMLSEQPQTAENADFVLRLVNGVGDNLASIDADISKYAPAWPVAQLPVVDRNVLRLAIFELLHDNSVPVKVAINEAVELAKAFGGESSAKFVNGVLSSVVKAIETKREDDSGNSI